jgi:endonuclease/exonuclease/phosphatase family metal-dependent hydrolase
LSACVLIAIAVSVAGCRPPLRSPEEPRAEHFSVLTYNVNYGGYRADLSTAAILAAGTDLVFLQETNPGWEAYLRPRLGGRYPHGRFRHAPAAGGMGVFSRWPVEEVAWHKPEAGWFHGWILRVATPAGPIQVLCLHLRPQIDDNGRVGPGATRVTGRIRLAEVRELEARLDPALPRLILGDFNEEESGPAVQYLTGRGYTDALPEFDRRSPTWRWRAGIIRLSRRFDHIMYSAGLHCCRAGVVRAGASDHFPVVALFDRGQ